MPRRIGADGISCKGSPIALLRQSRVPNTRAAGRVGFTTTSTDALTIGRAPYLVRGFNHLERQIWIGRYGISRFQLCLSSRRDAITSLRRERYREQARYRHGNDEIDG
jgi:hypothetical protein